MSAFDDYLNSAPSQGSQSFDDYLAAGPSIQAPVAASAPAVQPAAGQLAPLGGFLTGVGDVAKGTTQGIVHGLSWLADQVAPNSQFAKDARAALPQMQTAIDQQNAAYEAQRAAQQPQNLTGIITGQRPAPGIDWGRLAGNAVGSLPTALIGPEYAALSTPAKIALGAAQGGVGAAMMPTTGNSDDSYATQKLKQAGLGATLGAGVPAAFMGTGALASSVWNALKPVVQPANFVGEGLAGALSPQEAGTVAANIRNAPQYVPGSVSTTAQLGANPLLVQTEKALANASPDFKKALIDTSIANNDARWSVINGIAGTQQQLDGAIAARNAAAAPGYQAARAQVYPVDQSLETLMQRPAMQDALQRGVTIARNEGNQGLTPAVQGQAAQYANVPTGGTGFNGQPLLQQVLTQPATAGQPAQISGDVLHYLKLGLDDLQQSARDNTRLGPSERNAINSAQNDYLNWLDNASPDYAQARAAYAANSPPVNTMTAGQRLSGDLSLAPPNASNVPQITFPAFKGRYAMSLRGDPSVAQFGIDPAAQAALDGVQSDLQRSMVSSSIGSPGSDTAYNLAANGWLARNLFGPSFNGATGLGKVAASGAALLAGHPLAAGGIFAGANKLGAAVGGRLQNQLGSYLLDAQSLLPYLDTRAAATAQSVPNPLVRGLLNYGRPAALGGLLGGFINAPQ